MKKLYIVMIMAALLFLVPMDVYAADRTNDFTNINDYDLPPLDDHTGSLKNNPTPYRVININNYGSLSLLCSSVPLTVSSNGYFYFPSACHVDRYYFYDDGSFDRNSCSNMDGPQDYITNHKPVQILWSNYDIVNRSTDEVIYSPGGKRDSNIKLLDPKIEDVSGTYYFTFGLSKNYKIDSWSYDYLIREDFYGKTFRWCGDIKLSSSSFDSDNAYYRLPITRDQLYYLNLVDKLSKDYHSALDLGGFNPGETIANYYAASNDSVYKNPYFVPEPTYSGDIPSSELADLIALRFKLHVIDSKDNYNDIDVNYEVPEGRAIIRCYYDIDPNVGGNMVDTLWKSLDLDPNYFKWRYLDWDDVEDIFDDNGWTSEGGTTGGTGGSSGGGSFIPGGSSSSNDKPSMDWTIRGWDDLATFIPRLLKYVSDLFVYIFNSIFNALGYFPQLLKAVFGFLPEEFTSLMLLGLVACIILRIIGR